MTSTVLDVTVMLLCVSASVVALGAVDGGSAAPGAEAGEVADQIATETVTVTYASDESPNGTRTVHATRAELLALLVTGGGGSDGTLTSWTAFESAVKRVVRNGLGQRTRINARVVAKVPTGSATDPTDASRGQSKSFATGATRLSSERFETETGLVGKTGVPWRITREPHSRESEETATTSDLPEPVTVGSEPPRGATVAVAVITHPIPDDSDEKNRIQIVIRRW